MTWVLSIPLFFGLSFAAQAECIPNQTEVPACLSGTAVAPDYAGAVIQENGQAGLRQVMQGDIVAGWTVGEIGAGYVELKRGGRTARLEMPRSDASNVEEVQAQAEDAEAPSPVQKHGPAAWHSPVSPAAAGD